MTGFCGEARPRKWLSATLCQHEYPNWSKKALLAPASYAPHLAPY